MDCDSRFMKTSYSEEGRFGNYDLAEALMTAEYSNDRIPIEMKREIDEEKRKRDDKKKRSKSKEKDKV